jgi:hypothetical protein
MAIVSDASPVGTIVQSEETVNDVVKAALRKITGIAEMPEADQAAVGLEMLNNMLAEWRGRGTNVCTDFGLELPVALSDILTVRNSFIPGIKANLTVALCDDFDREITPSLQRRATIGFELIQQTLAPAYTQELF